MQRPLADLFVCEKNLKKQTEHKTFIHSLKTKNDSCTPDGEEEEADDKALSMPSTPCCSVSAFSLHAARSSSFENVCRPSAPKSWWLERSSFFLFVASSTVAKPRPAPPPPPRPRVTSRVGSVVAATEARLRGDVGAAAVVRKETPRRTMRRN